MDYSTCLMASVASRQDELKTQVAESLQPGLQRIAELVVSFFGPPAVASRDAGI